SSMRIAGPLGLLGSETLRPVWCAKSPGGKNFPADDSGLHGLWPSAKSSPKTTHNGSGSKRSPRADRPPVGPPALSSPRLPDRGQARRTAFGYFEVKLCETVDRGAIRLSRPPNEGCDGLAGRRVRSAPSIRAADQYERGPVVGMCIRPHAGRSE